MQNSIYTNTDIGDLLFMSALEQFYRMLYVLIYDFAVKHNQKLYYSDSINV